MADNKDYRSKVFGALKGELGDNFTKTEEQFNQSLDNEDGYIKKVYGALKGELGDSFTKEESDFSNLIGLKKKKKLFPEISQSLDGSLERVCQNVENFVRNLNLRMIVRTLFLQMNHYR